MTGAGVQAAVRGEPCVPRVTVGVVEEIVIMVHTHGVKAAQSAFGQIRT